MGKLLDAGFVRGSLIKLTDQDLALFSFKTIDKIRTQWGGQIIHRDPVQSTTTVFFPKPPSITTMGRRGERKVEY